MKEKSIVRITKSELRNFKNVRYGDIKYVNYSNVEQRAELKGADINGIYGQNGSGKTAIIEALDILQHIMSGNTIRYEEYAGMFDDKEHMQLSTVFYIEYKNKKYKARYVLTLKRNKQEKQIQIVSEHIKYWVRGKSWKTERSILFANPYYDMEALLKNIKVNVYSEKNTNISKIRFFESVQNLAIFCAQKNVSLFFNDVFSKSVSVEDLNEEEQVFVDVVEALYDFARMRFQVVKVNQLGASYSNTFIPMNVHTESETEIMQGCIPLFINGRGEFPERIYEKLEKVVAAINVALKSIISNLSVELIKTNEETNKDGINIVQVEVYSNRDGKRFLTKYESEGIKRIISLLNYLISLYNNPGVCLVVDELDAGIFEYLLGELIGVLAEEAEGQLIFTSHNLRIMEKLDKKNIFCSTVNPENRYISLTGIEKTNNHRDFYIRSIVLGGQKERLYDDTDLQDMGYAFKKAGSSEKRKVNLEFSEAFMNLLKKEKEQQ